MPTEPPIQAALEAVYNGAQAASQESETLDFKQDDRNGEKATLSTVTHASICFANALGGRVVLGVADNVVLDEGFQGMSRRWFAHPTAGAPILARSHGAAT